MNEASMNHSESHPARVNLSAEKNVQDWKVRLKHHSRNEIVLEAQRASYPPCKRVESMPNLSHSVRTSKIWSWDMQQSMQEADKQRTSRHFPAAYLFTLTAPSGCAKHHKPKLAQNRPDRQSCGTKYLWGNNMNIEQQKPQLVRWVLHGIAYLLPWIDTNCWPRC